MTHLSGSMPTAAGASQSCPFASAFDPLAPDYLQDPYPTYAALRAAGPVVYWPEGDAFILTRHEDIDRVFKTPALFSSVNNTSPYRPICPEAQAILTGVKAEPTLTNCDPPRHSKMRHAVSRCLTPRRWDKVKPFVDDQAAKLVDAMAAKPRFDLMEDLAFPLPAYAAFRLLGFPSSDTGMLKDWCGERMALTYGDLSPADQIVAASNLVLYWNYCVDFVERRRREPADDLTTDLLALTGTLERDLSVEDVVSLIYPLSLAAHETTTAAILNSVSSLLLDQTKWRELCAHPGLIPDAVEELLRFNSPIMALRRRTNEEVWFDEVRVPQGAAVYLLVGGANSDPARFQAPRELRLDRAEASSHHSFGGAWHSCLGAPLARHELEVVLTLLTTRFPNLRLENKEIDYRPIILSRSPTALWMSHQ